VVHNDVFRYIEPLRCGSPVKQTVRTDRQTDRIAIAIACS